MHDKVIADDVEIKNPGDQVTGEPTHTHFLPRRPNLYANNENDDVSNDIIVDNLEQEEDEISHNATLGLINTDDVDELDVDNYLEQQRAAHVTNNIQRSSRNIPEW